MIAEKTSARFIETLITEKTNVSIYLMNGVKLIGQILGQDNDCVLLSGQSDQLVYKHSISTIMA